MQPWSIQASPFRSLSRTTSTIVPLSTRLATRPSAPPASLRDVFKPDSVATARAEESEGGRPSHCAELSYEPVSE